VGVGVAVDIGVAVGVEVRVRVGEDVAVEVRCILICGEIVGLPSLSLPSPVTTGEGRSGGGDCFVAEFTLSAGEVLLAMAFAPNLKCAVGVGGTAVGVEVSKGAGEQGSRGVGVGGTGVAEGMAVVTPPILSPP
jgi:hypothetical protein